jgi:Fe-S cluster assembly ATP-binding protein
MRSDDHPMPDATLVIEDLHVAVEDKEILRGIDLTVEPGRVHALMGPNGSGKSTLAYALAGHPRYKVTGGKVTFKGEDVLDLLPDERARLGMFLAMQYPVEVPGVSVTNFLRTAINAVRAEEVSVRDFARELREQMRQLDMDPKFAERSLNEGFSGGEKKRHEILQMALLRPQLAILDETDSGLDIDALRVVADGVNRLRSPELGILLITHYTRILRYISPDFVHVMVDGRVVQSGGPELADELEAEGYERWRGDPAA